MSSLQNRKVCFKEKGLPITYYNFHHKSLVRPKSKIEKDLNPSDTNPIFHRDNMHLGDHKKKKTNKQNAYQNIWQKTKVRSLFTL